MAYFYSFTTLAKYKLILCNFQGESTFDHIRQVNVQFSKDPLNANMENLLLDFRDSITVAFKYEVVQYLDFLKTNMKGTDKVNVGILLKTPNQHFIMRIYKPLARLMGLTVENFHDLNDCLLWMKIAPSEHEFIAESLRGIKEHGIDPLT